MRQGKHWRRLEIMLSIALFDIIIGEKMFSSFLKQLRRTKGSKVAATITGFYL